MGNKTKRKDGLWRQMLTVLLPALAALIAGSFVFLCACYIAVRPIVRIELGERTPQAEAFLNGGERPIAYAVEPPERFRTAGDHLLKVRCGLVTRTVILRVSDTVPPAGDAVETTVSVKETLTPDKLVKNLRDESVLKLTYEIEPQFGTVGDYLAVVRLEDAGGNTSFVRSKVHVRITADRVEAEAGEPAPEVGAFLLYDCDAKLLTEITEEMMTTPDVYPVRILADGVETESELFVRDTVPPTAAGRTLVAKPGETVLPEDLLTDLADATKITAAFEDEPDPDSRAPQTVRIRLSDLGGNETVVESELLFSDVTPVSIEARAESVAATELLGVDVGVYAVFTEPFTPNTLGTHLVPVQIDGRENLAVIEVHDTAAPELEPAVEQWYLNEPKDAAFFVTVTDATETTVAFSEEPDWSRETQQVTVTAVDAAGNRTEKTFALTLAPDTEPPALYGVRDRYGYFGEAVAYRQDVSAVDACDGAVEVEVDASAVDNSKVGSYPVTYTATDRAGNTVSKTVRFTIVKAKATEAEAEEVAQKILKKILKDDMTLAAQIEAIFDYVFRNVRYSARSDKTDWRSEAVRGLTTGRGDCFTSYASARLLMEHTDAQIMSVERMGGRTRHYWLLVNIGTGWYHFDACNASHGKKRCFMWTNEQTNALSERYWRYDASLYPPVATERFRGGN